MRMRTPFCYGQVTECDISQLPNPYFFYFNISPNLNQTSGTDYNVTKKYIRPNSKTSPKCAVSTIVLSIHSYKWITFRSTTECKFYNSSSSRLRYANERFARTLKDIDECRWEAPSHGPSLPLLWLKPRCSFYLEFQIFIFLLSNIVQIQNLRNF